MKKILHIITLSQWGGAQRVCFDLVTNLPKDKFLVEVACGPGGILVEKLKKKGIKIYEISSFRRDFSPLNDFKTLFSLYRLIKKNKYDIVHCHSTKAGFLGRMAAKLAGVKKIYFTVHGWGFYNIKEYGWAQWFLIFLEKLCAKFSTKIICVSEKVKEDGLKREIAQESKFLVIKNGISFKVKEEREKMRKRLNIKEDEVVVGMVGRLAYQKDPLLFLKVAIEVQKEFPQTKFILIGGGPLYQDCQNFIKENNLNNILLLGEKKPGETRELLLAFDIFVLTSKFEGLPITIIEAMFAKLPIVASDVGGVRELVKNGENGFLIEPENIEDFKEKISYLIKNPSKRKEMGKENFNVAKENFNLEKMIRNYSQLYERD